MTTTSDAARVAILGAGWLGLPLGRFLHEKNYLVKGSTTRPERLPELEQAGLQGYCLTVGEQVQGDALEAFFDAQILILNIPPGRRQTDVETYHPRQIEAVLERAARGSVDKLLFISSSGVYGAEQGRVTEADVPAPTRPAGRALLRAEALVRQHPAFEATVLRLSGLVGGRRRPGAWLAGKTDLPRGDAPVNLIHRDDCIGLIHAILEQGAWNETFNLSADQHPARRAFYTAMAKKEGLPPPTFKAEKGPARNKVILNDKVKQQLGYEFLHPDPMNFP